VRLWDVRPFCPAPSRCTRIFVGAQHNLEQTLIRCAWSIDGSMVAAGSSDRSAEGRKTGRGATGRAEMTRNQGRRGEEGVEGEHAGKGQL